MKNQKLGSRRLHKWWDEFLKGEDGAGMPLHGGLDLSQEYLRNWASKMKLN
tara:strand:+ start:721 stop:873 length:153 start_codon:yes stop_codon:yes gene_type:complete